MIAASSPAPSAAARKVALMSSRAGRPKLTFETPSEVRTPSRPLHAASASRISGTWFWLVEAVMTRQSTRMRSRPIP